VWRERGFEANTNRGCSFFFGHRVLRSFLDDNRLFSLIRFFVLNFLFFLLLLL